MNTLLSKDMTKGSPSKLILAFCVPLLLSNVFQQLYNIVDSIVVGRFVGTEALAAVGTSFSTITLINTVVSGICIGTSILISQFFGAKDYEKLKKALSTSIITVILASLILTVMGLLLSGPVLKLLQTPANVYDDALLYLRIIIFGTTFNFFYALLAGALRAIGDSRTPLVFIIISTLVNVVLDLYFVIALGWSVFGVALATVIAQACSAALCYIYIRVKISILSLKIRQIVFDKYLFGLSLRYGSTAMVQSSAFSVGMMAIQGLVNSYGSDVMAAYLAASKVESLCNMLYNDVGTAVFTFTGQNVGAGNYSRVKKGVRSAFGMCFIISTVMMAVMFLFGKQLIGIFVDASAQAVIRIGAEYLTTVALAYVFMSGLNILNNTLRASGDMLYPMVNTVAELTFRVMIAYGLAAVLGYRGIWFARPLSLTASCISLFFRYRNGGWMNKAVLRRIDSPNEQAPSLTEESDENDCVKS